MARVVKKKAGQPAFDIAQEMKDPRQGSLLEEVAISEGEVRVEEHAIDARILMTFDPGHAAWEVGPVGDLRGAIVRLIPPAGGKASELREACLMAGARAVRVLPAMPEEDVVLEGKAFTERGVETLREAALATAREANAVDKETLLRVVEEVLGEAGL